MIAIDLAPLVFAPRRGVARALHYLIQGLERVPRGELVIHAFVPGYYEDADLLTTRPGINHLRRLDCPDRSPRSYRRALGAALRGTGAQVLLSPWAAFPKTRVPVVAWIHEVPFARKGALEGTLRTLRHRRALARAVERAAALVVPSYSVREDLLHLHPEAERGVHVVPHGFEPTSGAVDLAALSGFRTLSAEITTETMEGERLWPPEKPYALLVGTGRGAAGPWKKGVDVFVDALADARLAGLRGVVVGAAPGLPAHITVAQEPDDALLASLVAGARVLVVPSRSEGFGYPMLEGFAAGVPVVASAAGALPEVSGGAARLVPPGDVDALADALHRVHSDEDLRARLIKAGHRRASEFPVEAMAQGWLRVLTKAGGLPWHD